MQYQQLSHLLLIIHDRSRDCDVCIPVELLCRLFSLAMCENKKLNKLFQCILEWDFDGNFPLHVFLTVTEFFQVIHSKQWKMCRELFVALLRIVNH